MLDIIDKILIHPYSLPIITNYLIFDVIPEMIHLFNLLSHVFYFFIFFYKNIMWSKQETATQWYHRFRGIITKQLTYHNPVFQGEVEVDESYFGGKRKGKRGRGASGKIIVFGLYKRNGYVHALTVSNTKTYTLYSIIKEQVAPDSIVYTDAYHSYNILDVFDFRHYRINHATEFTKDKRHINGIENFWNASQETSTKIQWNTERTF